MGGLDRGMGWCRKRQALLRLADGRYTPARGRPSPLPVAAFLSLFRPPRPPTLAAVRLPDMGQAVVHGRDVACSFADAPRGPGGLSKRPALCWGVPWFVPW